MTMHTIIQKKSGEVEIKTYERLTKKQWSEILQDDNIECAFLIQDQQDLNDIRDFSRTDLGYEFDFSAINEAARKLPDYN